MHNIWRQLEGFRVIEVDKKMYQFFFAKETDMKRVLKEAHGFLKAPGLFLEDARDA